MILLLCYVWVHSIFGIGDEIWSAAFNWEKPLEHEKTICFKQDVDLNVIMVEF